MSQGGQVGEIGRKRERGGEKRRKRVNWGGSGEKERETSRSHIPVLATNTVSFSSHTSVSPT